MSSVCGDPRRRSMTLVDSWRVVKYRVINHILSRWSLTISWRTSFETVHYRGIVAANAPNCITFISSILLFGGQPSSSLSTSSQIRCGVLLPIIGKTIGKQRKWNCKHKIEMGKFALISIKWSRSHRWLFNEYYRDRGGAEEQASYAYRSYYNITDIMLSNETTLLGDALWEEGFLGPLFI